jgi:hypothetical protein
MGYLGRYAMGMWLCIISGSHSIHENVLMYYQWNSFNVRWTRSTILNKVHYSSQI